LEISPKIPYQNRGKLTFSSRCLRVFIFVISRLACRKTLPIHILYQTQLCFEMFNRFFRKTLHHNGFERITFILSSTRQFSSKSDVKPLVILGIESTCDDTGVAIIHSSLDPKSGGTIAVQGLASQFSVHAAHGGVVPNLAAREHRKSLPVILRSVLNQYHQQQSPTNLSKDTITSNSSNSNSLPESSAFHEQLQRTISMIGEEETSNVIHEVKQFSLTSEEESVLKNSISAIAVSSGPGEHH
jgi:hypothetical protein